MARKTAVLLTANFERNLQEIGSYLSFVDAPGAFANMLDELLDTVIPNLERFPELGRPFLERKAGSIEVESAQSALRARLAGGELREYVLKNYLVLYSRDDAAIRLLAIRHHRQLAFDLGRL